MGKVVVVHFSDCFYPRINGVTIAIDSISWGLSLLNVDNILVVPCYDNLNKKVKLENFENIKVFRLPSKEFIFNKEDRFIFLNSYKELISIFKNFFVNYEKIIFLFHNVMNSYFIGKKVYDFFSNSINIVKIAYYHTFWEYYLHYVPLPKFILNNFLNFIERSFFNHMDYVMVTNDYVKNRLILKYSNGSRGKLENKIFVNPLPLNRFFLVDDYVNIDDNGIDKLFQRDYFLYVGRIGKEKNLYFLIDVFYSLAKKLDNVFLYIVGDGPEKENLFLYVKSKSLSDRVLFLGYLSQSKLVNLYRNCKGVIFVSKTETLGLAVLEAMACGALIFTLAVEPFISFVKDRGILVDSEDPDVFASKIVETVTNKDLFSILKQKALSYSLQFHPRVFAENFLKMVL